MQHEETVLQVKEADRRNHKMTMLAEEYKEKSRYYNDYYNCLIKKCDPVECSIIRGLIEVVEEYERCVADIYKEGYTIQQILDFSLKGGVC